MSQKVGIPQFAVEKDWWVVNVLRLVFSLSCSEHLVFKGGTSLSKAWNIIERFSEDIDLALDREFLNFKGELSESQVKKLREKSCEYITNDFFNELKGSFKNNKLKDATLKVIGRKDNDTDPIKIEIAYKSYTEPNEYLPSRVLIEVGSRSLMEPFTNRSFANLPITIPVVNPERTLLEKIFLLHETFQKSVETITPDRLSRHHYDIVKLMQNNIGKKALNDENLFNTIVEHRKQLNFLKYVDYTKHVRGKINIIPPDKILPDWEKDYNLMKENMIYGPAPAFKELMEEINKINLAINKTTSE